MLETGRSGFGSFADFASDPSARLYVSIGSADETLFIGLSPEYTNNGVPFTSATASRYQFRIKRDNPTGFDPIVHGPFTITNTNANAPTYEQAEFGMYDTDFEIGGVRIFEFQPDRPGDYYIEFDEVGVDNDQRVNIPFWDFTVVRNNTPIDGRVWSRGWAFRTPRVTGTTPPDCVWDRQFNGKLYSYTEDGFVSLIDFEGSGFQGLSFNIAFNTTGPGTSGDLAEDRKSIPDVNATLTSREHRVFLTLPDINIFPDGICGEIDVAESFRCTPEEPYCLQVDVTRAGQVEILLDFNGNGILDDDGNDVALVYDFPPDSLSACVPWNGLRGNGTPLTFVDTVDVIISYNQGVQHYAGYDVEFLKNGFCVETVRPNCSQELTSSRLFYDDRDIPEDPGTDSPKDGRSGFECGNGARTWDNFELSPDGTCNSFNDGATKGYGDKSTLNTYWFASSQATFRARVPVVSANIVGNQTLCEGETSVLRADDAASASDAARTYLWEGPGVDGATTEVVTIDQPGEYCVTINTSTGCSSQTCVTVTIADFSVATFPPSLDICFGESLQLPVAGNPDFNYVWSPATGVDNINSNQPTFSPTETTTYTVTISNESVDGQICQTTNQVIINVASEIGLSVVGGGPICDEQTTITASTVNAANVELFAPDMTSLGTGNSFTVDVSGSTDYLLVATNAQNCTDSVTFTVSGGPVNIIVPDSVLACLSDGVNLGVTNLDGNDELTYSWTPTDIFAAGTANDANPTFNAGPGDYNVSVTVTNQFGCNTTEDLRLVVLDDDGALGFTANVNCDGATVRFTNTSTVGFGYIYDFGDGTTSTDPDPDHVYDEAGVYTVTLGLIFDGQTCVTEFTQEVTTFDAVLGAGLAVSLDDCDNGSASINFFDNSLNATGAELTYSWIFTGVTPTTSTDLNPTVTVTESGTISARLIVTSEDDCTSTLDTTFTVDLSTINLEEEVTICPGESTTLNPGATGNQTYNWSPSPDFGANEANPTTSTAGTYIVTVTTDAADFNCSNVDTIVVVVADSINLVINGPDGPINDGDGMDGNGEVVLPTITSCGTPIDLTVDLTINPGVTVSYTDLDGNPLGTGGTFTLTPNDRDTVVVTAVNEFGCIERDTIVLINNQVNAGIDVGADGFNFCAAADTSVSVVNNDPRDILTYAWEPNDIINGPLDGESVDFVSPEEGSVDLMVTVTNQFGCDTMITVTITSTPFTPNQYDDVIMPCFDEGFTIDGGPTVPGYEYVWEPAEDLDLSDRANPVGTFDEDGNLFVTITDPVTGCIDTQTVVVDVAEEISFVSSPMDTVICAPADITVNGTTVNPDVEITWYSDEELTMELGNGNSYVVEADDTGETYIIYGEAVDLTTGCRQSTTVRIRVSDITASLPLENIQSCAPDNPNLFGDGTYNPGLVYDYEPAGLVDLSDPNNPVFGGTESAVITTVATDPLTGCSTTTTTTINVSDITGVSGTADPEEIFLGETSTLMVIGCDDCTYEWNVPNGTIEPNGGSTVVVTPDQAGTITYEVTVISPDGCTQTVLIELRVEDPLCDLDHVYVPNAFSPNGDNSNDVMRVRSSFADQLTEFRWIIYNRWGQEVYSSDDPLGSWDGTIEGDDLEPDVYGYWLRVRCPAGQELVQQGNITILR